MAGVRVATDRQAVDILSSRGWLAHVDEGFRDALFDASVLTEKRAGQSISYAGDEAGCAWGIIEGQVDLTSGVSAVDASIGDVALAGDWWGFRPLRGNRRAIHAVARTHLLLAEITHVQLTELLKITPVWWRDIATLEAMKQERWGGAMMDMTLKNSKLRCIAVLLRLSGCRQATADTPPVTIHFTQEQLSAASNISRYPTGTILRGLAAAGLVGLGYGTISVLKPAHLRAMVEAEH